MLKQNVCKIMFETEEQQLEFKSQLAKILEKDWTFWFLFQFY